MVSQPLQGLQLVATISWMLRMQLQNNADGWTYPRSVGLRQEFDELLEGLLDMLLS